MSNHVTTLKNLYFFQKKTSLLFLTSKDTTFFALVQIKWTDWPKLQCLKQFRLTPHKQYNEHTQQYKIPLIDNFQKFTIFNIENEGSTHKKQSYSKEISFSIHKIHCHYRVVTETLSRDSRRSADGQLYEYCRIIIPFYLKTGSVACWYIHSIYHKNPFKDK